MIVLGLLLLIVVVVVAVVAIARGGDPVSFKIGSLTFETDGTGMFLAGAGTLLLAVLGLWLLRRGLARSRERRHEVRELRDRAARNEEAARRERETAAARESAHGGSAPSTSIRSDDSGRHVDTDPDEHFDSTPRER